LSNIHLKHSESADFTVKIIGTLLGRQNTKGIPLRISQHENLSGENMTRKALIADDEPRYRELLKRVLEKDGYTVMLAECGETATDMLLNGYYDLVVTDLDMPGLNGFDVIELANRLPHTPPVLLVTAQKTMLDEGWKRLGEGQCLLKPFSLEDFRAKVGILTGSWRANTPREN
jgi:DNA-binding response OmpR family regulator